MKLEELSLSHPYDIAPCTSEVAESEPALELVLGDVAAEAGVAAGTFGSAGTYGTLMGCFGTAGTYGTAGS